MPPVDLPCAECGGQCCIVAAMSAREYKHIRRRHGVPKGAQVRKVGAGKAATARLVLVGSRSGRCPWLVDGRCSIYADRPQSCRDYGHVPDMPCAYLYPEEAKRLFPQALQTVQEANLG